MPLHQAPSRLCCLPMIPSATYDFWLSLGHMCVWAAQLKRCYPKRACVWPPERPQRTTTQNCVSTITECDPCEHVYKLCSEKGKPPTLQPGVLVLQPDNNAIPTYVDQFSGFSAWGHLLSPCYISLHLYTDQYCLSHVTSHFPWSYWIFFFFLLIYVSL